VDTLLCQADITHYEYDRLRGRFDDLLAAIETLLDDTEPEPLFPSARP
tara:strand:- start:3 stop:146 length:144 start_codon:yes stop_codon:yes gene_type:complete